jgi:hypothetical protein
VNKKEMEQLRRFSALHNVEVQDGILVRKQQLLELANKHNNTGWVLESCDGDGVILYSIIKMDIVKAIISFDPAVNVPYFEPCEECEGFIPAQEGQTKRCGWFGREEDPLCCWAPGGNWLITEPFFADWTCYHGEDETLTEENILGIYLQAGEVLVDNEYFTLDLSDAEAVRQVLEDLD